MEGNNIVEYIRWSKSLKSNWLWTNSKKYNISINNGVSRYNPSQLYINLNRIKVF
jgi:hypothetical protein